MKFDVLILAGGEAPEELKQFSKYNSKATLEIGGRLMIEYVIDALLEAPGIGRILVVGAADPLEKVLAGKVWKIVPPKDKMLENLQIGLDEFKDGEWLLVSTCDIPLIKGEMIGRFVNSCPLADGDVFYSVIEKRLFDATYPTTKRTYAKLKDGTVSGGNIVLMRPDSLRNAWSYVEAGIAARKSPLKLARIIGIGFIFKFIFRLLTLKEIENKLGQLLKIKGRAVTALDSEIGIDVDKQVDFDLVRSVLEKK